MMPADFSGYPLGGGYSYGYAGMELYAQTAPPVWITVFSVSEDGSAFSVEGFQPTEAQPRGF